MSKARARLGAWLLVASQALVAAAFPTASRAAAVASKADPVVVATFDTGTNPFHPCFRRAQGSPRELVPTYPATARPLPLKFKKTYEESLEASQKALESIKDHTLYYVPGTNLSFYGGAQASTQFVDDYPHGAQASSQIACEQYGMASNAQLVILNWYDPQDLNEAFSLVKWAADQPWIDVVHLNIQDVPTPLISPAEDIAYLISKGKFVVIAAGNGVLGASANYPMEISRWNAPVGSLIAGANDNGGYTNYSNLDPHVVMDGCGTVAAEPDGFGDTGFSGTSSASPRITGYAARLLGELRAEFGHTGKGLLTIPSGNLRPKEGPLQDGKLVAAELHEVIRKTANPNPHDSKYDGDMDPICWVPQPADLPFAFYPKMGYGEISEHTLPAAFAVAAGREPMPERPNEDRFYELSEELRRRFGP
ncbi:MAG TPA: S8/S53 family peptidase [Actinomycetota bacterium]|nr:S8/S53 family peptidase [Actinomycetota bacterium]